jgi:asparagine synthase (glutamine-hydrolysing)
MCGILGMVGKNSANFVSRNIDSLEKRGPDSKNIVHISEFLSLGATRLAMVDRHVRSNQPLMDESGNLIIFNGEIYNYLNLKKTLSNSGLSFYTESDTEVLLKLLTFEGDKAIPKLQGMFAFAFYVYDQFFFFVFNMLISIALSLYAAFFYIICKSGSHYNSANK